MVTFIAHHVVQQCVHESKSPKCSFYECNLAQKGVDCMCIDNRYARKGVIEKATRTRYSNVSRLCLGKLCGEE